MSLRPGGVTGIALLFIIGAASALAFAIVCIFMTTFITDFYNTHFGPLLDWIPIIGDRIKDIGPEWWLILGYILLPIGAVEIVTSYGLLKLKSWGYWLAILMSIPLILLIIGIIFIWYLRKDEVKAAFDIA